jgi:hypothetical protein
MDTSLSSHHIFCHLDSTHTCTPAVGVGLLAGVDLAYLRSLAFDNRRDSRLHPTVLHWRRDWTWTYLDYIRRSATRARVFSRHDTRLKSSHKNKVRRDGRARKRERERGMGRDAELHNDREALRVAIIAGVSLSLSSSIFLLLKVTLTKC